VGSEGPYMSESKIPTLNPWFFKVAAMLTAIVLFPTPPLQLDTAMIFLIPLKLPFLLNFSSFGFGAIMISASLKPAFSS
jgi:hypothetical protein